MLIIVIVHQTQ